MYSPRTRPSPAMIRDDSRLQPQAFTDTVHSDAEHLPGRLPSPTPPIPGRCREEPHADA
ncbi:hypothetical protein C8Q80DRAFT_1213452 [Daedaleopsis nitida]|nr:hypothetical protein C8Q80DRAFT_1213452 [Daedaleopsis nitida]